MLQFMKIDNIANVALIVEEVIRTYDVDINNPSNLESVYLGVCTSNKLKHLDKFQVKQLYYLGCMLRQSKPWIAFAAMFENWDYIHVINTLAANEKENV